MWYFIYIFLFGLFNWRLCQKDDNRLTKWDIGLSSALVTRKRIYEQSDAFGGSISPVRDLFWLWGSPSLPLSSPTIGDLAWLPDLRLSGIPAC
jgi:hypothetical protein